MFKFRICPPSENDFRPGLSGELDVPADEIGVQMRFDDVFYFLIVGCA
jgi:hypothetical protein